MTISNAALAGVIGSPIAHSKSPRLHGYWLRKYRIDGYYIPIELNDETFETGLKALSLLGFKGVNVTLPYKIKALDLADIVTSRASQIGAANTLTFLCDGRIQADNTDGYGFIANLKQQAPDWSASDGPALVLGAGGAARAIIYSLLDDGAPEIILSNRTGEKAEQLQARFGEKIRVADWDDISAEVSQASCVVNTTSLGMTGQPVLPMSFDQLRAGTLVTDIVYAPLETELLKTARARGCRVVDGLGMLLHQAAPGFEAWFGQKPTVDDDLRREVLRR